MVFGKVAEFTLRVFDMMLKMEPSLDSFFAFLQQFIFTEIENVEARV